MLNIKKHIKETANTQKQQKLRIGLYKKQITLRKMGNGGWGNCTGRGNSGTIVEDAHTGKGWWWNVYE